VKHVTEQTPEEKRQAWIINQGAEDYRVYNKVLIQAIPWKTSL
jgi:hypothetical protein